MKPDVGVVERVCVVTGCGPCMRACMQAMCDREIYFSAILTQAEEKNISLGGPKFYSPGVCPAQFKYLKYGEHILSTKP